MTSRRVGESAKQPGTKSPPRPLRRLAHSNLFNMEPDDTICFCFHVSCRKLRNYARHHKPSVPSLMSECLGAGTGCGWCRPLIVKIWEQNGQPGEEDSPALATPEERKAAREKYWLDKFGKKPE